MNVDEEPSTKSGGGLTESMSTRRWWVLLTVGIGTLLSSLNTSMVNTILPVISHALRVPMNESEWIVLSYLLVLTLFLLPIGRLADLFGYRPVFLSGFVLYVVASLLCSASSSFALLVTGRSLLALAGAMILAVGPALISTSFSVGERGRALGLQALMTYIGLSAGPVMGGWLTDSFGWQSTFFGTIPFAVLGFGLGVWCIKGVRPPTRRALDFVGIISFIVMMAAITMLLNSNAFGRYQAVSAAVLFVFFAVATWIFWRQESRAPEPMIRLSLFRIRNFGFGTAGAGFNYLCFFLALYLLPFYFNTVLHASASVTGDYLTIAPLVMMVCAPVAGALSDKMNSRIIIASGMVMSVLSLLCFAWMGAARGGLAHLLLIVGLLFTGLGTGWFAAPNNSAILGAAPRSEQGVASGTLATFRYVGMMAGITVGGSLFDTIFAATNGAAKGAVSGFDQGFLDAFVIVMLIGAALGLVGVVSSLMMKQNSSARSIARTR